MCVSCLISFICGELVFADAFLQLKEYGYYDKSSFFEGCTGISSIVSTTYSTGLWEKIRISSLCLLSLSASLLCDPDHSEPYCIGNMLFRRIKFFKRLFLPLIPASFNFLSSSYYLIYCSLIPKMEFDDFLEIMQAVLMISLFSKISL